MLGWAGLSERAPNTYQYTYQYPRGSHTSRATVSNARADVSSLDSHRYLGVALIARWAHGRLPLFYLFSTSYLFSTIGTTGYLPLFRYAPNASR